MALTETIVENWLKENVSLEDNENSYCIKKEEIRQAFNNSFPCNPSDQKDVFFSIVGNTIKRFSENVTVVKKNGRKMGYRGFLLKNLAQLNGETVKNWAYCNLAPGTATDIVDKECLWQNFQNFIQKGLLEQHREVFFVVRPRSRRQRALSDDDFYLGTEEKDEVLRRCQDH